MRVARVLVPLFCTVVVALAAISNNTNPASADAATPAPTAASTTAATSAATTATQAATGAVSSPAALACNIMSQDELQAAQTGCGKAGSNSACLAHAVGKLSMSDNSSATFEKAGDSVDLTNVSNVTTEVTDPASGSAGVVVMKLQGGLPLSSSGSGPITAVLFGDSSMTSSAVASPAASNQATAAPTAQATAQAASSAAHYNTPMQSFTLNTANGGIATKKSCGSIPSGLLLQSSADQTAHLLVNGVDVAFNAASVLIRATPKDRLEIAALSGKVTVSRDKDDLTLNSGTWTRIRLGGKDGLTTTTTPPAPTAYTFAAIDGAPLDLLPDALTCTVGVPAGGHQAAVRVGPGAERGGLFFMTGAENFPVKGQGKDSSGALWWQLQATGRAEAWVAQSDVHSVGVCTQVAQATPPPVIAAGFSASDSGSNSSTQGTSEPVTPGFAPTTRTIWQANPGPITQTG